MRGGGWGERSVKHTYTKSDTKAYEYQITAKKTQYMLHRLSAPLLSCLSIFVNSQFYTGIHLARELISYALFLMSEINA